MSIQQYSNESQYHLCVWADEAGFLGTGHPYTEPWISSWETQGLTAAKGGGGQAPFASSTAVVWDVERTALVVVQSTSCRGRYRSKNQEVVGRWSIWVLHSFVREFRGPFLFTLCASPSHLSPCLTSPNNISPQWSQKAGARYECTLSAWGRIWKSSKVAAA